MIDVVSLDIEIIPLNELIDTKGVVKVDTSANLPPMMVEKQFGVLKDSIKKDGQTEPILIWRSRIVDGRNRVKALLDLGIEDVKARRLPHKVSTKERIYLAKRIENTRRHETSTQIACSAVVEYFRNKDDGNKLTADEILVDFACSKANFNNAKWLYTNYRADFDILREGGFILLPSGKSSDSLSAIKAMRYEEGRRQQAEVEAQRRAEDNVPEFDEDSEEDENTSASKEDKVFYGLADQIIPSIAASQKLNNFNVEIFFAFTLRYMREEGYETSVVKKEEVTQTDDQSQNLYNQLFT